MLNKFFNFTLQKYTATVQPFCTEKNFKKKLCRKTKILV